MSDAKKPVRYKSALIEDVVLGAEKILGAKVITFESQFDNPDRLTEPGGMCSCCGGGPRVTSIGDWWLVFQAGLVDEDGVFYAMLCDGPDRAGCLTAIRAENATRKPTARDEAAALLTELLGDDVDAIQAEMDDLDALGGWGEIDTSTD